MSLYQYYLLWKSWSILVHSFYICLCPLSSVLLHVLRSMSVYISYHITVMTWHSLMIFTFKRDKTCLASAWCLGTYSIMGLTWFISECWGLVTLKVLWDYTISNVLIFRFVIWSMKIYSESSNVENHAWLFSHRCALRVCPTITSQLTQ